MPCNNGECVNLPGTYECRCYEGYAAGEDSDTCNDIDECAGEAACGVDETCYNLAGTHDCCNLDTHDYAAGQCTLKQPCAGFACADDGSCSSVDGACSCGVHAELDSGDCVDIDECALGTH